MANKKYFNHTLLCLIIKTEKFHYFYLKLLKVYIVDTIQITCKAQENICVKIKRLFL